MPLGAFVCTGGIGFPVLHRKRWRGLSSPIMTARILESNVKAPPQHGISFCGFQETSTAAPEVVQVLVAAQEQVSMIRGVWVLIGVAVGLCCSGALHGLGTSSRCK